MPSEIVTAYRFPLANAYSKRPRKGYEVRIATKDLPSLEVWMPSLKNRSPMPEDTTGWGFMYFQPIDPARRRPQGRAGSPTSPGTPRISCSPCPAAGCLVLPDPDQIPAKPGDPLPGPGPEEGAGAALRIHTCRPSLTTAVTAAAKVAQLVQLHRSDLLALFELRYQQRTVAWSDFCYGPDPDSLAGLYGRAAGSDGLPVAVHGTVTRAGTDRGGLPYRVIASRVPAPPDAPQGTADVHLRTEHATLLAPLTVGRGVLALSRGGGRSQWRLFRPTSDARHQVVLWVQEHWQLAHWTTDPDTGVATAPRTPPPLQTT
ncbi:hypothetical protein [Kitasatospora sp. NPDC088779]|uniref:hypothetical protein n=1 Tax=Kitasatospora sp. NPDC088779 TaxID=3154964 RepID=UPI00342E7B68